MVKKRHSSMQWSNVDLHIHTPASGDFQQPGVDYLDILRRAEARSLDIIALTDHNTVMGYRRMQEEIQQYELLERLKRIMSNEQARLSEYRRLIEKILVLPGFEFTATFGFHILGIFPPEKPLREIEHLLLDLNIPTDQLDAGSATVGASTDVLTAYRLINEAGGLVIAAHANSSNGIAMRGFPLGGQTKIAYTQDPNLHALEVTDLESKSQQATAKFFNGTKPEYPRRMHCIQGSDSHRLTTDPIRKKNLGLGDRTSDLLLPEISFEAIKELFQSNDFARTRPHRYTAEPVFDFIHAAQEEGANIIQDFHENISVRGGKRYEILADVCAFANTNGGTLYLGISADPKKPVIGIPDTKQAITQLEKEISNRISPELPVKLDSHEIGDKKIVRMLIPRGEDSPYAVDDNKIYIRSEAETGLAVRDEIVGLVLRSPRYIGAPVETVEKPVTEDIGAPKIAGEDEKPGAAPRTGVEVVSVEERGGGKYYTMRDLRNGEVVKNVTRNSARRLWHYAITSFANLPSDPAQLKVQWQGDYGLLREQKQGESVRYDFVQRTDSGLRFYFGVTEDGLHGPWKRLLGREEE
ncbi:MAG: putative transcriptional regulator [Chloroflexi bacterium]|nr:putative transcriptional regulator [Chloroflexota bacterium]